MLEYVSKQLAKRLDELKPHVKVLSMSGYTGDLIARRDVLDRNVAFLGKPFSRDMLGRKVREALTTK
ncbi:MAG: hypothetical protein ACOCUY_01830 [Verrucomicrobiota bacterium]